jgi:microcystin degradation protein MlrC
MYRHTIRGSRARGGQLRVATLGLFHEANTFSSTGVDWAGLEEAGILRGNEVVDRFGESGSAMGGFLAAGREIPRVEVVPLVFCRLTPTGPIAGHAFDRFVGIMLDELNEKRPWDAVLLALHGAAVAGSATDADGEILRRVRETVGESVPIGVTLDLHANVTEEMIRRSTVTTVFRTNPHVDARERALACAELIASAARGRVTPVQALVKIPLVPHILCQGTADEPLRQIMAAVEAVAHQPGVLSADLALGFPYADTPDLGMASIIVHDGDPSAAQAHASMLARLVWEHRDKLWTEMLSVDGAVETAKRGPHPLLLLDVGDNVGGGGPADSTHLLDGALGHRVAGWLQTLYDPESVAACARAGVGSEVTLWVGGKTDGLHGGTVCITGRVERVGDGAFEDPTPTHGGQRFFDAGPTAVVGCERDMILVLTSRRLPNTSLNQMRSLGIEPDTRKVIAAKGVIAPRAAYGPVVRRIVAADSPGVTRGDFTKLHYERRPWPLYPFERDMVFSP